MNADTLLRQIAFSQVKGLDLAGARQLAGLTGGVDAFFDLPTRRLWQLIGGQKEYCSDTARAHCIDVAAAEMAFIGKNGIDALYYEDESYPRRLLECDDSPVVLYRLGKCGLNARHVVSVVGTRRATAYGLRFTADLIAGLASRLDGLIVVSGLAYGIDVAAHRAALQADVPTVAVVAHGLRTLYPADHRDVARRIIDSGGAIVTEYVSDASVHRGNFRSCRCTCARGKRCPRRRYGYSIYRLGIQSGCVRLTRPGYRPIQPRGKCSHTGQQGCDAPRCR